MNTISEEHFLSLRHGDIVQWGPDRTNQRTILCGPGDMKNVREISRAHVHFPIRHRSWTGRLVTGYMWSEMKHRLRWTGKRTRELFSPEELFTFTKSWKIPSAQLERDLIDLFDNDYHRSQPHLQLKCSRMWRGAIRWMIETMKEAKL